jgi:hypothetical protein
MGMIKFDHRIPAFEGKKTEEEVEWKTETAEEEEE